MDDEAEKLLSKENSGSQEIHPAPEHSYSKELITTSPRGKLLSLRTYQMFHYFLNKAPNQPPDCMSNTSDVKRTHYTDFLVIRTWML